jgi:hypothetical protein
MTGFLCCFLQGFFQVCLVTSSLAVSRVTFNMMVPNSPLLGAIVLIPTFFAIIFLSRPNDPPAGLRPMAEQ